MRSATDPASTQDPRPTDSAPKKESTDRTGRRVLSLGTYGDAIRIKSDPSVPVSPEVGILSDVGEFFARPNLFEASYLEISSGTEPAYVHDEVIDMDTEARLVLDEGFERAVARVVDAFVCEGFTVRALEHGNLHRPALHGSPLRFALLDAALLDRPIDSRAPGQTSSARSRCRLCMVELTGSCTLITAEQPLAPYSLSAPGPRLAECVARALRLVMRHRSRLVAA